eukprot:TRINITY_DN15128_c0_g1_i1.p1 TRINITY_DN15128_c0_g1~~TRINITY_DN15128_c0_g1_i1.p1  ORF type:complete len:211 (+),score=21.10 TRINITY_DN15128_c0_g1_i1:77-709(+)
MTDILPAAQLDTPISNASTGIPMEAYFEEIAEIFTQDWFEFEEDCIAEISDPIIELHNEIILTKHDKEELDHIMHTSEDDITNFVRCELDKLRSSIFEQLTLDPSQISFERTKSLESLDAMINQGDSGKAKKKKKGFFETLRLKRSDHDEEISPSQSPNDRDKKGFTNKLKNLFKIKRKTSPKPSRKHASESDESESEDLGSNSEELKDH